MGRKPARGSQGRSHQVGELVVEIGPNNRIWVRGTLHLLARDRGRIEAIRVRRGTRLDPAAEANWRRAIELADEIQRAARAYEAPAAPIPFADLASHYLRAARPSGTQLDIVAELVEAFGLRPIAELEAAEIAAWYARRFPPPASPATIRRHKAGLKAILNRAAEAGLVERRQLPDVAPTRLKRRQGRALARRFLPGEAELLIESRPLRERAILATLYCTGARPSMALWLKRADVILAPGRGRIFFPESKNGRAYDQPLPDYAVEILAAWLASRDDAWPELFLTPRRRPYKRTGRPSGGHLAESFRQGLLALMARLVADGRPERARAIEAATPRWFRSNFANAILRPLDGSRPGSIEDAMAAGMWESPSVLITNYLGRAPEHVERLVRALRFGDRGPFADDADPDLEQGEQA